MKTVIFSTTNPLKLRIAQHTCRHYGINVQSKKLEIDEIQSEDFKKIAVDKAHKAYEQVKKPVVITDDSWSFNGLNGFPGPYMSSMNYWFNEEDFLRLTHDLTDRRVMLTSTLVYFDGSQEKVFTNEVNGTLIKEARGKSPSPNHAITVMDGDEGTIAEVYEKGVDNSTRKAAKVWHDFAKWYKEQK